jgi:hypothetical protein
MEGGRKVLVGFTESDNNVRNKKIRIEKCKDIEGGVSRMREAVGRQFAISKAMKFET